MDAAKWMQLEIRGRRVDAASGCSWKLKNSSGCSEWMQFEIRELGVEVITSTVEVIKKLEESSGSSEWK